MACSNGGDVVMTETFITDADRVIPPVKYEYLDHPADVQLHSWGGTLEEAFEQVAMAMFAYMTDIERVSIDYHYNIEVEGLDMLSLLYQFLDEFLFAFSCDPNFIPRKIVILDFDKTNFKIKARGFGETFRLDKHSQGTEVKAITYSNMQVYDSQDKHETYVIIDI